MNIPLTFTLDFFEELFQENVINKGVSDGIIQVLLFRNSGAELLEKAEVSLSADDEKGAARSGSLFSFFT